MFAAVEYSLGDTVCFVSDSLSGTVGFVGVVASCGHRSAGGLRAGPACPHERGVTGIPTTQAADGDRYHDLDDNRPKSGVLDTPSGSVVLVVSTSAGDVD